MCVSLITGLPRLWRRVCSLWGFQIRNGPYILSPLCTRLSRSRDDTRPLWRGYALSRGFHRKASRDTCTANARLCAGWKNYCRRDEREKMVFRRSAEKRMWRTMSLHFDKVFLAQPFSHSIVCTNFSDKIGDNLKKWYFDGQLRKRCGGRIRCVSARSFLHIRYHTR